MLTTSLPAPASDMASAPTWSPAISLGRYFAFCSGLAQRRIWLMHKLECVPYDRPMLALARLISSTAITWSR